MQSQNLPRRRKFIRQAAVGAATLVGSQFFKQPGLFAEELLTPSMTEGPFYPDRLPLDTDNDLLIVNNAITPAVGEITHLTGKVMDQKGNPIRNARVEIWQCDEKGVYLHSKGGDRKKQDRNFQGFGRFATGLKAEYYFRTIKPVPYPGRTPHIHFAVYVGEKKVLSTQCMIKGHELNAKDGLLKRIKNTKARESLIVNFKPLAGSKIGELTANFDIVVGLTPNEDDVKG
ncbi:MAG: protocatechuate 3,4-dioxygenase [Mariniblastus sp.]|nr:protocatechuate 3,4-dioxygenase [Mariniblastus sp.]